MMKNMKKLNVVLILVFCGLLLGCSDGEDVIDEPLNFGNLKNLNTYLGSFNEIILKNQLQQFDFVLCNILAEVIKGMIPNIYKCLRNNGEVIFSGILNSQKDEIIKILIQHDLKLLDVSTRKDWACISAQKASNLT